MCNMVPAKIIQIHHIKESDTKAEKMDLTANNRHTAVTAKVEVLGIERDVNILMIKDPKPGDYVLIHAGYAIQIIDKEYYKYLEMIHKASWEESY